MIIFICGALNDDIHRKSLRQLRHTTTATRELGIGWPSVYYILPNVV